MLQYKALLFTRLPIESVSQSWRANTT